MICVVADAVGAGDAEEHRIRRVVEADALQAELGGAVLVVGERHRIDLRHLELAVGVLGELPQHVPHPAGVGAQVRDVGGRLVGEEEVQVDRLGDVAQRLRGARRQRVELVLREVQPRAAQDDVGERHGDHEDHRQGHEAEAPESGSSSAGHDVVRQSAFFRSSTTAVAYSQAPITIRK